MGSFQVLVETVSLGDKLLLPLAESLLFDLDLFGETLAQSFLFLLELGVVQLPRSGFAELPRLHLLRTVGLVVLFFGRVNEIQHVSTDQNRTELSEVAVLLLLDLSNTPGVLTALDDLSFVVLDILLRSDHGERHSGHQGSRMVGGMFVIVFNGGRVDLDTLSFDNIADL